jgi:hypothetical protein
MTGESNWSLVIDLRGVPLLDPEEMGPAKLARKPATANGAPKVPKEPKAPKPRIVLDVYETPPLLALAIAERLRELGLSPARILEPSAASGNFVQAARATWPDARIAAVEARSECKDALTAAGAGEIAIGDFAELAKVCPKADLIIGNPPFKLAEDHLRLALELLHPCGRLAFLLRLAFLASARRQGIFEAGELHYLAPIVPRPSFTIDAKHDYAEYALFVFERGFKGPRAEILPALVWSKP